MQSFNGISRNNHTTYLLNGQTTVIVSHLWVQLWTEASKTTFSPPASKTHHGRPKKQSAQRSPQPAHHHREMLGVLFSKQACHTAEEGGGFRSHTPEGRQNNGGEKTQAPLGALALHIASSLFRTFCREMLAEKSGTMVSQDGKCGHPESSPATGSPKTHAHAHPACHRRWYAQ